MDEERSKKKDTTHEEPLEEVAGIRMANARIPRFLVITYISLAAWAIGYAILAQPVNERTKNAAGDKPVSGEAIVQQHCLGCHNLTNERLVGPGLKGVGQRLPGEQLSEVLLNGRGAMPSLPNQGLDTEQIKAVEKYLRTL
ncbi:cytochrome c [Aneurinibacillus sp. BA2021]|nr:cytochrome c [Aneurinibacillus sp. BA2021]